MVLVASIKIANWNLEWARRSSWRGQVIHEQLSAQKADIICLTEAYSGFLCGGYVAESAPDYGYPMIAGRRKVCLWSRWPLRSIDQGLASAFPPGRFLSATAETPLGDVKIVGVCIPWRDAHVRTGRRDRSQWQDHLAYLRALGELSGKWEERTVVVGDFNQRVPPRSQPKSMVSALRAAMAPNLAIATAGLCDERGAHAIDHIAVSKDLEVGPVSVLSSTHGGKKLSDHFGWSTSIQVRG